MKCPHCFVEVHPSGQTVKIGDDCDGSWATESIRCPSCDKLCIHLISANSVIHKQYGVQIDGEYSRTLVYPKSLGRVEPSYEVPEKYKQDFLESCWTLNDSPKASAALSRRCLQHLLRDVAGVKKGSLQNEIQQVIDSNQLPSYISEAIDAVRNIGNFAAHPVKCTTTGEIAEVENGEAEWNLDVLESLFDFYFVQPAILKRKRDALNSKLAKTGKPPMKSSI
jgi:hypothetical protein